MKRFIVILILSVISLTLSACNTNKKQPGSENNNNNNTTTNDENLTPTQADPITDIPTQDEDSKENIIDKINEAIDDINDKESDKPLSPPEAKRIIQTTSDQVITALKNKDMDTLSQFIDPEDGVRFTLYSYVDTEQDLVFDRKGIQNFLTDEQTYLWGYYDGSGEAVELTPSEYYDKFIYDQDFANADDVSYNETLSGGTTLNNQSEVYGDDAIIVEYYFQGFEPEYEGLDWESLTLVFEEEEDTWYLVAIISNRMTI